MASEVRVAHLTLSVQEEEHAVLLAILASFAVRRCFERLAVLSDEFPLLE